jgi:hypothetical protein
MTKEQKQKASEKFGKELIGQIMESFEHAYRLHKRGESLDAILIRHDIMAAYAGVDKVIISAHQRAIRSAVNAVDQRVPLELAKSFLLAQMNLRLHHLVHDSSTKTRVNLRPNN